MRRAVALAFALVALAGCQRTAAEEARERVQVAAKQAQTVRAFADNGIRVWADPETGCQYLVLYGNGITPRFTDAGPGANAQYLSRVRGCRR